MDDDILLASLIVIGDNMCKSLDDVEGEVGLDGARVTDVYREVINEGCEAIIEGRETVVDDNALAAATTNPLTFWMTFSPSATISISLVSCVSLA